MTQKEFDELTEELVHYTMETGQARNFEINDLEIRARINSLNAKADFALDRNELEEYKTLCFFAYQYYRLFYS